jgi:hypothetical protein
LASCEAVDKGVVEVMEIDMEIHDIENDHDGIILISRNGERIKVKLNEQERELLKERLEEKV